MSKARLSAICDCLDGEKLVELMPELEGLPAVVALLFELSRMAIDRAEAVADRDLVRALAACAGLDGPAQYARLAPLAGRAAEHLANSAAKRAAAVVIDMPPPAQVLPIDALRARRKADSEKHSRRYHARKAKKLCVSCGRERAIAGRTQGPACLRKLEAKRALLRGEQPAAD